MTGKFGEWFGTEKIVLDGHVFVIRKPSTPEAVSWLKGIPSLSRNNAKVTSPDPWVDPAVVAAGIELYLMSVDGEPYDPKTDPAAEIPFGVAMPLYNSIFRLAVPQDEAEAAGRILRG